MAASLLKGRGWLVVAVATVAAMGLLSVWGTGRQQMLQDHQASGTMRDIAAERVVMLRVVAGGRQWRLLRGATGWAAEPPVAAAGAELGARVDAALRLLRNAAPEREFEAGADATAFGLAPARLRVSVHGGADAAAPPLFEIAFGAVNPIGLAHYSHVTHNGRSQTLLLPSYVAEAWEAVVGLR